MSRQSWGVALLLLCMTHSSFALDVITGRVVSIADGDTVTVLDAANQQHKIRLSGIDAPEKAQAFGNRSKQHLSDAVYGKLVEVEVYKRDRYRREVGVIRLGGLDMNLKQVEDGMAWHYTQYANEQPKADRVRYSEAEATARKQRLGLWTDRDPVPPWDFRRSRH